MTRRVILEVEVDLDMMPGMFHTEESACLGVQALLEAHLAHYRPAVSVPEQPKDRPEAFTAEWAQGFFARYLTIACPNPSCDKGVDELCDTDGVWIHVERVRAFDTDD